MNRYLFPREGRTAAGLAFGTEVLPQDMAMMFSCPALQHTGVLSLVPTLGRNYPILASHPGAVRVMSPPWGLQDLSHPMETQ